jgi:hypothetical protein
MEEGGGHGRPVDGVAVIPGQVVDGHVASLFPQ